MSQTATTQALVLHLIGPGRLKVVNGRLAFRPLDGRVRRFDERSIRHIAAYGPVSISDQAVRMLLTRRIPVAFMSRDGRRCQGRLGGAVPDITDLRLRQYQAYASSKSRLAIARWIVAEKIQSQIAAARHYQRQGKGTRVGAVISRLRRASQRVAQADSIARLLPIEANASKAWFGLLGELVRPRFAFTTRRRRPPTDPVNALLSLGYTLVSQTITAHCVAGGLDPDIGALHATARGRPSLACDLVEPLRAPCVDRWVVRVCGRSWLDPGAFTREPGGGVRIRQKHLAKVLAGFEDHQVRVDARSKIDATLRRYVDRVCR